jgi:hypothetical protein
MPTAGSRFPTYRDVKPIRGSMMLTRSFLGSAMALVALAAACRYTPSPVLLQGEAQDLNELAGEWSGEYSSVETGRAGSILFKVVPQSDTAHGDVVMVPNAGTEITAADVSSGMHQIHAPAASVLRITFVRVAGGEVEGALEPYIAPDCQCVVRSVFRGVISGDRITGMYTTYGPNGMNQEGGWSVTRK